MRREYVGAASVESGMVLIGDPGYINSKWDEKTYEELCVTLRGHWTNTVEIGGQMIAINTEGDGSFPVYAEYDEDVVPARIVIEIGAGLNEIEDDDDNRTR